MADLAFMTLGAKKIQEGAVPPNLLIYLINYNYNLINSFFIQGAPNSHLRAWGLSPPTRLQLDPPLLKRADLEISL